MKMKIYECSTCHRREESSDKFPPKCYCGFTGDHTKEFLTIMKEVEKDKNENKI